MTLNHVKIFDGESLTGFGNVSSNSREELSGCNDSPRARWSGKRRLTIQPLTADALRAMDEKS